MEHDKKNIGLKATRILVFQSSMSMLQAGTEYVNQLVADCERLARILLNNLW